MDAYRYHKEQRLVSFVRAFRCGLLVDIIMRARLLLGYEYIYTYASHSMPSYYTLTHRCLEDHVYPTCNPYFSLPESYALGT